MPRRLIATFTESKRVAKVYRDSEWQEYRVTFGWLSPDADYFTPDKDDALDTARHVVAQH